MQFLFIFFKGLVDEIFIVSTPKKTVRATSPSGGSAPAVLPAEP
jgi:hypothetical protein